MRELALVGKRQDHQQLVARDLSTGEEFIIHTRGYLDPVSPGSLDDSSAHADSVRTDQQNQATQPPQEAAMEMSLTPREIQARIRHGENSDTVAKAAGVPHERIDAYAVPILAERAYIARKARETVIRRKHVGTREILLGELVENTIRARGGSEETPTWDSWRNKDGRWTIALHTMDSTATFTYDVAGRFIIPADQAARDLTGDITSTEATSGATVRGDELLLGQKQLAGGDSTLMHDEDTALADALLDESQSHPPIPDDTSIHEQAHTAAPATEPPATNEWAMPAGTAEYRAVDKADTTVHSTEQPDVFADEVDTPPGVSSLKAARERRALEQLALADGWGQSGEHAKRNQPTASPSPQRGPTRAPGDTADDANPAQPANPAADRTNNPATAGEPSNADDTGMTEEPGDDNSHSRTAGKRRQERRRVPSWDEIMFGQGSSD